MAEIFFYAVVAIVMGLPVILLALAIRHFIPLMRGWQGPWWAGALGPFAFADHFVSETARTHRNKCIAYTRAFVVCCLVFLAAFGKAN
jgi:hypothetical protein